MSPAFNVPRIREHTVERPRLTRTIATERARSTLTLVHGPAGSGKSTLLAQWARERSWLDEDLVWVTLRADDAGVVPFWTRIAESLVQAGLVAPGFGLATAAGDFSTMLLGAMSTVGRPISLVLDDYHLVGQENIDHQIRVLLLGVPGFSVLLGTRSTTELHSLEVAARISTTLVDAAALIFTLEESNELVAASGLGTRADLGTIIHEATGGWPLASQALVIEAQRSEGAPLRLQTRDTGSPQFAREFARSSLAALPEDVRDFLLKLSFADECTIELASDLTGEPLESVEPYFLVLERNGLGTLQSRSGAVWFRMHPLLRESVETEALARLTPEASRRARATLSDRLGTSRALSALEIAVSIQDWERAERLILLNWVSFSYYNRVAYSRILNGLPANAFATRPALLGALLVEDYNVFGGDLRAMQDRHAQLIAMTPTPTSPTIVGGLREVLLAGVNRLLGDLPRALAHSELALASLRGSAPAEVRGHTRSLSILHTHVAVTHYFDRQPLRAIHEMTLGNELATEVGSTGERLQSMGFLAAMQSYRGEMNEARVWMGRCEAADPYDGWIGGYLQAPYLIARALDSINGWDPTGATGTLDLLDFIEPVIELWPWIAAARAYADLLSFGPAAAHARLAATLARAKQRPQPPRSVRALLVAIEAQLLILNGQPGRANVVIEETGLGGEPEIDLVRARLASLSRDDALAAELADSVVWSSTESPALRAEALLTIASSALEAGQRERAGDAFADAAIALERSGLRLPLLWLGRERADRLLAAAREQGRTIDESILLGVPEIAPRSRRVDPLSAAEKRVLTTLRETGDVATAAEALFLSPQTVRYHLKRSYRKLGVTSRMEALALAQELGMLDRTR